MLDHRNEIHRINYLISELQSVYHQSSLKFGISDSVSAILYAIYDAGNDCLLSDIYKNSGISKQTIHSAMRSLEADGMLCLVQAGGRAKKVVLTKKGTELVQQTAARLFQAEMDAFNSWTAEEIDTYIHLMEHYLVCFRTEVEAL